MKSFLLVSVVLALLSFSACGGGGTIGTPPPPQTFTVGGNVTGLTGTVVLQNNGSNNLTLSAIGAFTFSNPVASGAGYSVTVLTQPSGETCTVNNGTGSATANVTSVQVICSSTAFTIGGSVGGLAGTVVLQDNGSDNLTLSASGSFTFNTPVSSGAGYSVTVLTQPAGETCTVTNGIGTATANVSNVQVACTASSTTFTIGGTVTGLTAGGLVLQNNAGDDLTVGANGGFTFHTPISSGATYNVTVSSQPNGQTCTVSSGSGTATANVTNVSVTCAAVSNVTISIVVSGLTASTPGLVVEDNGINPLSVPSNGTYPLTVPSGTPYAITVSTQPTGATCLVSNGTGTANSDVTVTVACTPTTSTNVTISVVVSGLTASTTGLVIEDNGINPLSISSNGTYPITVAAGTPYAITVSTQPTGGSCTVTNGSGTANTNVTVTITCTPNVVNETLSVAVTGLTGTLVMQDDKADNLTFTTNITQQFATSYASGSTYAVTVKTQPSNQTCTVGSNGSGTITANTTVTVTCVTNTQNDTISVAVTGLTGTLVVQDDKADTLSFTTNSTQTFATSYTSGASYTVSVKTQPAGQTCTLGSNATGIITANTTVTATCTTTVQNFTLSVAVTGLTGTLVMQDDKTDTLTFTSNNTQGFATQYASGSTYTVSVQTQPSGQTCTLSSNASGTITANTTVTATCAPSSGSLTVSVAVTGLSGTVTLTNDQGDVLTFTSNKTQSFSSTYTSGSTYTVYVSGQPSSQSCIPTYSTGTITSNVTINAACATGSTRKLGTVSGVKSVSCSGAIANGVCQQMTVSCPSLPDVFAYVKTNAPSGTSLGTVTYGTGTDGNGLYESIFTFGSTAVQNVLNAGFTTVQISWGTPFNNNQPSGWVEGPGGVLAGACRYATVTQWIYDNIQNDTTVPYCATANSGGSGALAYALSQYPPADILAMAEVTSGPPTGRLDWGCGCVEPSKPVQCGSSSSLGTCFGVADAPVWDPAYDPNAPTGSGLCSAAVNHTLPPGGLNFFLGDSVEAPGAAYNLSKTHVNLVFGDADNSSAIPIGQDWFNNITSTKTQACVSGGMHSLANTLPGAQQIANDLIGMCKLQ